MLSLGSFGEVHEMIQPITVISQSVPTQPRTQEPPRLPWEGRLLILTSPRILAGL